MAARLPKTPNLVRAKLIAGRETPTMALAAVLVGFLALDRMARDIFPDLGVPVLYMAQAEERLYPGMCAEVSLEMNRRPDALTLLAAAVGSDGDGNFVYTLTENRITRTPIKIGVTDNGRIEVTAGLPVETPVVATIKSAPPPGTPVQQPARVTPLAAGA